MEHKVKMVEENHQQIAARMAKLEAAIQEVNKLADPVTGATSKATIEEVEAELAKYSQLQAALQTEIRALSQELSCLQLAVTGTCPDLSFLKNQVKSTPSSTPAPEAPKEAPKQNAQAQQKKEQSQQKKEKPAKEAKPKEPKPAKAAPAPAEDAKPLDVSRLDLRVGKIVDVQKHPDAESLYLETIDCGEEKPRTVISGLVKFVPIEEMQNRMVVVLCNLKPAKMRGVLSEAMVMCASTPEKVEVLSPPAGAVPGDRVSFEKFPGAPDAQLNPKKKIWEQIAPDLSTNGDLVATYKGDPFVVTAKGPVLAQTLKNVPVK